MTLERRLEGKVDIMVVIYRKGMILVEGDIEFPGQHTVIYRKGMIFLQYSGR